MQYLEINKKYIFLDDDEEIVLYSPYPAFSFSRIYINEFISSVRVFTLTKDLIYENNVHEELNVKTNNVTNIKVKHHVKIEEYTERIITYTNMTNNLYYKIRNNLWSNNEYLLSNEELNMLDKYEDNWDFILLLIISKSIFNFSHNITDEVYLKLVNYIDVVKLNRNDQIFITKCLLKETINSEEVFKQQLYQNKFQLLQKI